MRIDNRSAISTENRDNIGDLINRLETGDVIKVRVLESSQHEAVLRLSNGSILKAATGVDVDITAGQTVTLTVKSRSNTSIEFGIVKDLSHISSAASQKLQKTLEALGIKPDEMNIRLAAEFLKYGVKPNAENISKAAELIRNHELLDAEKATFIVLKNLDASKTDPKYFAKFLDGELKLGTLLESLHNALGKISDAAFGELKTQLSAPTADNTPELQSEPSVDSKTAPPNMSKGESGMTSEGNEAGDSLSIDKSRPTVEILLTGNNSPESRKSPAGGNIPAGQSGNISEFEPAGRNGSVNLNVSSDENQSANKNTPAGTSGRRHESGSVGQSVPASGSIPAGGNRVIHSSQMSAGTIAVIKSGTEDKSNHNTFTNSKNLVSEIKESIDDIFIKIDKELSDEQLDINKAMGRVTELLKKSNILLRAADRFAGGEDAVKAAVLINETVKLLDMANTGNVLYFQLPVDIAGQRTTAELYVMKRRSKLKKIDPQNAVLFLSLDTANLGRVETLLEIKGNGISINLRTESEIVNDFIKANIKSLYSGLKECGCKLVDMKYSIMGKPSSPTAQEKMLQRVVKMKHERVDLRI